MGLSNIVDLACGANHVLALDKTGDCFSFGAGQQGQLGRQIVERHRLLALQPSTFGLKKRSVAQIATGADHSFITDRDGHVWAWGLNSYGECAIQGEVGADSAAIMKPTKVEALDDYKVTAVVGGAHHSLALTENKECLTWGRIDGFQTGHQVDTIKADKCIQDEREVNKILIKPLALPDIKATYGAIGSDHSFIINEEGKPFSWGFSINYQTGQGTTEDIEVPTLIDNTAIRGKKVIWAGAGGQYGILATAEDEAGPTLN
jgi:regulator of chromosome condensation